MVRVVGMGRSKTKKKSITEKQHFAGGRSLVCVLVVALALISISLVSLDVTPVRKTTEAINNQLQPLKQSPPPQTTTLPVPETVSSLVNEEKKPESAAGSAAAPNSDSFRNVSLPIINRTSPVPSSLYPTTRPAGLGTGLGPGKELNNRSDSLSPLKPWKKKKGAIDLHFIHIPKCGGTSMTAILRQVLCQIDPERNIDCCTNPGFCDWHAFRRCEAIRGNPINSYLLPSPKPNKLLDHIKLTLEVT